jgi:hypothetical protein
MSETFAKPPSCKSKILLDILVHLPTEYVQKQNVKARKGFMSKEGGFVSRSTIQSYCFVQPWLFQGMTSRALSQMQNRFMNSCPIAIYLRIFMNIWPKRG